MNALPTPPDVGVPSPTTTGGPTSAVPQPSPGAAGLQNPPVRSPMENVLDFPGAEPAPPAPATLWAIVVLDEHAAHPWPEGLVLTPAALRLTGPTSRQVLELHDAWRSKAGAVPAARRVTHHLAQLVRCDTVDGHRRWLVQSLQRLR